MVEMVETRGSDKIRRHETNVIKRSLLPDVSPWGLVWFCFALCSTRLFVVWHGGRFLLLRWANAHTYAHASESEQVVSERGEPSCLSRSRPTRLAGIAHCPSWEKRDRTLLLHLHTAHTPSLFAQRDINYQSFISSIRFDDARFFT